MNCVFGTFVPLRRVWLLRACLEELIPASCFVTGSTRSSSMVCPMVSRPSLFTRRSRGPGSLGSVPPCSADPSPEITAGTRLFRKSMVDETLGLLLWCIVQWPVPRHSDTNYLPVSRAPFTEE